MFGRGGAGEGESVLIFPAVTGAILLAANLREKGGRSREDVSVEEGWSPKSREKRSRITKNDSRGVLGFSIYARRTSKKMGVQETSVCRGRGVILKIN